MVKYIYFLLPYFLISHPPRLFGTPLLVNILQIFPPSTLIHTPPVYLELRGTYSECINTSKVHEEYKVLVFLLSRLICHMLI